MSMKRALVTRIADEFNNKKIRYREFEKYLNKKKLEEDVGIEEMERTLREPLVHKNDLATLIRKAFENDIDLRDLFKKEDHYQQGLIEKDKFYQILERLPLGYSPEDIYSIFKNTAIFDAHGNADYTVILQHDAYALLEKNYLQKKAQITSARSHRDVNEIFENSLSDSRKVVVEEIIYVDDFDFVLYTTTLPKSSNIYVSHTVPFKSEVIPNSEDSNKNESILRYKLLATLKGHTNNSPPVMCYIEETCCLLTGEKDDEPQILEDHSESSQQNPQSENSAQNAQIVQAVISKAKKKQRIYEILIWNLQKDLIHMMQANPPWTLKPARRISAHSLSILDISYLPAAQIIVTSSMDQTIKFFDPTANPYLLSEPHQFPVTSCNTAHTQENTLTNEPFSEVKRIYTAPSTCYKLQILNITGKSAAQSIEWLAALKLSPIDYANTRKSLQGSLSGYGIERVKLKIPAVRHDDPVPSGVFQECESAVAEKRKKAVVTFQSILPHNLEYLMANVALRTSLLSRLGYLFSQATLNRVNGRIVDIKPLKEAFQVLLEMPERKRYGNLIKEKGRNNSLTVSEVYYYLKKYSQIHPTNLSQVMFAKLVEKIKEDNTTNNYKQWHSDALNIFSQHIRKHGLPKEPSEFTTDEFIGFLETLDLNLEQSQLESIVHEIDALNTGKITQQQLTKFFAVELKHFNVTMFKRPTPIIDEIRAHVLPFKKLRLQEALNSVDIHGDGYISKKQFLEAFEKADIKVDIETLNYLFELLEEKYIPKDGEKVLSVAHFLKKLLNDEEAKEGAEIEQILKKISGSLNYRGIEPEVIFLDCPLEKVNVTIIPKKLKEVIEKSEFIKRVKALNITHISDPEIEKLANYLSVSERTEKIEIIYMNTYLHHLKNVSTYVPMSQNAKKALLSVMCSKLLLSEARFKRQCYELTDIIEGCIEPAGARAVLTANGIISRHADLFVEFIMGSSKINLDDLIAKMKAESSLFYKDKYQAKTSTTVIPQINYHENLKTILMTSVKENCPTPAQLAEVCQKFDKLKNGKIKLFHLLQVLKHNLPKLDEIFLAGLQYELSMIHPDEYIDYENFFQAFTDSQNELKKVLSVEETKLAELKSKFDTLLKAFNDYISKNRIDIKKAFEMFDTDRDFMVNKEELKNVLQWIDLCSFSDTDIDILYQFSPKEQATELFKYKEFLVMVANSNDISATFNKQQWASAAKGISMEDQCKVILENIEQFKFLISKEYPGDSNLIPGEVFINCLRDANLGLSEEEIEMVAEYAIRGSKRLTHEQQANILSTVNIDKNKDLINFPFFEQSLILAFNKKASDFKEESDRPKPVSYNPEVLKKAAKKKEADLISKVKGYFTKTGLSFYDYFLCEETGFLQSQLQYF